MKRIALPILAVLASLVALVLPSTPATAAPVQPLVITTAALPTMYHGYSTATQLQAAGGTKGLFGYSWSVAAGSLPAGLTLSKGGRLAGTVKRDTLWPTYHYEFTVAVADSRGLTAQRDYVVDIVPMSITSPATLPGATKGRYYSYTMKHLGGCTRVAKWAIYAPNGITYSLNGVGAEYLPTGMKLARSSGTISGIPKVPGTFSFVVEALCDANNPFSLYDRGLFTITVP